MNNLDQSRLASMLTRLWKGDRARAEQFAKERAEADYKKRLSDAAGKVKVVK